MTIAYPPLLAALPVFGILLAFAWPRDLRSRLGAYASLVAAAQAIGWIELVATLGFGRLSEGALI